MGRPAASSVVWTGAHSLNHPSSFGRAAGPGRRNRKDISRISQDILQITDLDMRKEILGYYKDI